MSQILEQDVNRIAHSSTEKFFTVKIFAQRNKEQGTWPSSEAAIWALRAGSPKNGFGKAFISVGRRVLINEEKFWEAVSKLKNT